MSKLFDPVEAQNLMEMALEENATRRDPLPQGETTAQIMELKFSGGISQKTGNPWNRMDCTLEISDPEYLSQIPGSPEKATTTLGIMLDMNNGQIATGPNKNIRLGRLRAAAGVNGKPLSALQGQFVRITIGHKPHPTEEGVVLDEVTGYTKA